MDFYIFYSFFYSHSFHCIAKYSPVFRNEAFWFRGGIQPDARMVSKREGTQKMQKRLRDRGWKYYTEDGLRRAMTQDQVSEPYERALQYTGANLIQVRDGGTCLMVPLILIFSKVKISLSKNSKS